MNVWMKALRQRLSNLSAGALLLIATLAHAGTVHYYYTDPQGSVLAKTDAQGNVIATYHYQPYGSQSSEAAVPNGPGYTGHVEDPDTGLVYMQQRYYDPVTMQFLSVDPLAPSVGSLFNFNRYDYANNNPVVNIDPEGRQSEEDGGAIEEEFARNREESFLSPAPVYRSLDAVELQFHVAADTAILNKIENSGAEAKAFDNAVDKIFDTVNKIPNSDLKSAPAKRGNSPIGNDGHPVELHHQGQQSDSPVVEITRTDHRMGENYKKNHENTGQDHSNIDRADWKKQQKQYWRGEWDRGRFHDMPSGGG